MESTHHPGTWKGWRLGHSSYASMVCLWSFQHVGRGAKQCHILFPAGDQRQILQEQQGQIVSSKTLRLTKQTSRERRWAGSVGWGYRKARAGPHCLSLTWQTGLCAQALAGNVAGLEVVLLAAAWRSEAGGYSRSLSCHIEFGACISSLGSARGWAARGCLEYNLVRCRQVLRRGQRGLVSGQSRCFNWVLVFSPVLRARLPQHFTSRLFRV